MSHNVNKNRATKQGPKEVLVINVSAKLNTMEFIAAFFPGIEISSLHSNYNHAFLHDLSFGLCYKGLWSKFVEEKHRELYNFFPTSPYLAFVNKINYIPNDKWL